MSSAESYNCRFRYHLEQKSAVDPLHGTPSERNMVRGLSAINITLLRSEEMTFARGSKACRTFERATDKLKQVGQKLSVLQDCCW